MGREGEFGAELVALRRALLVDSPISNTVTEHSRRLSLEHAREASLSIQLADTVERAIVKLLRAGRLRLQPDTNVLDRSGHGRVRDTGDGARGVQLAEAQHLLPVVREEAFRPLERAELDRDARADTQERGQGALVETEGAVCFKDLGRAVERRAVGGGVGLDAHFDDVEGLRLATRGVKELEEEIPRIRGRQQHQAREARSC